MDLLLEPYVGFGQLVVAQKDTFTNDYTQKDIATGFMLGTKGGMKLSQTLFLALDYQTCGPYNFDRVLANGSWTGRSLGGGIGLDYPAVRFYLGYYFDHQFNDSQNNILYKGVAYKVGFGLPVGHNLRANLDIDIFNIKTQTTQGSSPTDASSNFQTQAANVSLSIPVDLK